MILKRNNLTLVSSVEYSAEEKGPSVTGNLFWSGLLGTPQTQKPAEQNAILETIKNTLFSET